jgi:hypothetical protein
VKILSHESNIFINENHKTFALFDSKNFFDEIPKKKKEKREEIRDKTDGNKE